jgi:hypothetical protein
MPALRRFRHRESREVSALRILKAECRMTAKFSEEASFLVLHRSSSKVTSVV